MLVREWEQPSHEVMNMSRIKRCLRISFPPVLHHSNTPLYIRAHGQTGERAHGPTGNVFPFLCIDKTEPFY